MNETTSRGTALDPLLFPKDDYTVETKTVKTSAGEKTVAYHSYMHIPYVANPPCSATRPQKPGTIPISACGKPPTMTAQRWIAT